MRRVQDTKGEGMNTLSESEMQFPHYSVAASGGRVGPGPIAISDGYYQYLVEEIPDCKSYSEVMGKIEPLLKAGCVETLELICLTPPCWMDHYEYGEYELSRIDYSIKNSRVIFRKKKGSEQLAS